MSNTEDKKAEVEWHERLQENIKEYLDSLDAQYHEDLSMDEYSYFDDDECIYDDECVPSGEQS